MRRPVKIAEKRRNEVQEKYEEELVDTEDAGPVDHPQQEQDKEKQEIKAQEEDSD